MKAPKIACGRDYATGHGRADMTLAQTTQSAREGMSDGTSLLEIFTARENLKTSTNPWALPLTFTDPSGRFLDKWR